MRFPRWLYLVMCALLVAGVSVQQTPALDLGQELDQLERFSNTFAEVAAAVRPGVVTIFSERVVQTRSPFNDPFFREFFGGPFGPPGGGEQRQQGLGSGVVVSRDGYVLTNNHVIEGADRIRVEFASGKEFDAEVVGTDPKSDLAVLKVNASDLPTLPLGDSDRLRVGQWVLAVGNPFGLQHTVTYGIVSAVGRGNVGLVDYEDFIQTDAAINPGNSGGALVNLRGEVVGVNSAIVSRSGGYQGIGFAIPINMARNIMGQLIERGRVSRGYLGVSVQDLTPEMAEALGLRIRSGVVIGGVEDGSPADQAGLKRGDVIEAVEGMDVKQIDDLRNRISQTLPGTVVSLRVRRKDGVKTVRVKLGELPSDQVASADISRRQEKLGWEVQELTGDVATRLGYEPGSGVLISGVQPGGVAQRAGLRAGDLILEVNRQPVRGVAEYSRAMEQVQPGEAILLLVRRGRQTFFTALRMPQ